MESNSSDRGGRRLPAPATAIALVALYAAIAGSALALPGRNTVDSGDIANGEVKGADVARNAIAGKHVKEKSLAAVPEANAVGGQRVQSFHFEIPDDTPEQTFAAGGIRLEAECDGGSPTLFVRRLRNLPAVYHSFGLIQNPTPVAPYGRQVGDFVPGDTEPLAELGSNAGQATAHVLFDDGRSTQIEAAYRNVPPGGGSACSFWGRVISD